ncbi:MAG: hypothetical protein HS122_00480 [Opitutaceae bacterium]|nr:hypothetical protein [Opitutaceae bacterium]
MTAVRNPALSTLGRILSTSCALLVVALALMSASPALHDWAHNISGDHATHDHAAGQDSSDHGCVVVWFGAGLTVANPTVAPDRPPTCNLAEPVHRSALAHPRRVSGFLPQGRAPPKSLS